MSSRDPSRLRVRDAPSRSRSRRPRASRNSSLVSVPYLPDNPDALVNPDGQIGDEAAELLHEFVHPHRHDSDETLTADEEPREEADGSLENDDLLEEAVLEWRQSLPWWKRPSPWWFIFLVPFSAIAISATMAPRIQIYTQLVCDAYKPEFKAGRGADKSPMSLLSAVARSSYMLSTVTALDDRTYELCAADPVVQQAVSKLSLAMLSTMGILGCLTTAWWGSLSDRFGRTRVMSFSVIGLLTTDVSFIVTATFANKLPGGYWFLLFGPIVEGMFGGISSVMAAIHAYIADCTDPAARSRAFSLFLGLLFTGMSVGPTLASLLIKHTRNLLAIFYIATAVHIVYAFLILFIIPESLAPVQRAASRKLWKEERKNRKEEEDGRSGWLRLKKVLGFAKPLAMLVESVEDETGRRRRDWSLLMLVAAYGCVVMLLGSITSKMQYMTMMFEWSAEQVGYWSSTVSAVRALWLTVLLPVIISFLQPKASAVRLPVEPDEPLVPSRPSSPSSSPPAAAPPPITQFSSTRAATHHHHAHLPAFDLALARVSLLIEMVAYTLMASAHTGTLFTAYSALGASGAGFGPAINSVAATLYSRRGGRELGKLFGALSVVQVICSQILGPFLYGVMYMSTVATFPRAVFFLSVGSLTVSFVLLSCIRLPKDTGASGDEESRAPPHRESTLVDADVEIIVEDVDEEEAARGRKPGIKPAVAGGSEA
ncbi:MFS general substrate transporter [Laetiporus sulphureus 93-53]|uniref:MFS general substrate transporter n=1 Tax=Laetiporus sulphureus 93-53 TaxID=1314785 RepID=A0A165G0D9_9APHY|nr:MFS general substrate transporter [Laetiporus sulphureus 93-53]KZT09660.1 MFS general substrate transporter [Laetiporus sulphureus 93-53]